MHHEVVLEGAGRIREAVPGPDDAMCLVFNDPNWVIRLSHLADFTDRNSDMGAWRFCELRLFYGRYEAVELSLPISLHGSWLSVAEIN